MDADIKVQVNLADRITKALANFKKSPKDRVTVSYIETRLESLETLWENFASRHEQLVEKYTEEDLTASIYGTRAVYDTTDEVYLDYKCALKTALRYLKVTPSSVSTNSTEATFSSNSKSMHVKLPKITIPTFSGLYSEWMSFRDLFVSLIHNNKDIDNVQKLHYLKGHLKGEAEQLLRHIPITNDSYGQCWTLLENRYNNKQYLVNCILKRFFGQKSIPGESSSAIKELLDITTETLNALKGLGIDTSTWDVIVIYIVSQKLDSDSRKQWESKVSELVALADQLPTIKHLQEFLETKYHSLEFLDSKPSSMYSQKQRTTHSNYKSSKPNPIQTLHVTQPTCVYCKQGHNLRSCKEFISIDLNDKRNFVQSHGLCFNCLGSNHSVKHCRNTTSCQICHRRHHSLLHPKGEAQSAGSSELEDNQVASFAKQHNGVKLSSREELQSTSSNITSHFVNGVAHQVLLATAMVYAESHNGGAYQLVRALIDQGSQASFITRATVQLLGLKPTPTKGVVSGLGGEQSLVTRSMVEVTISSRLDPGCVVKISAYVLDKLTAYLPATAVPIPSWPELACITLADPEYYTPNRIDMLLGAEVYGAIIEQGLIKCPSGSLIAQNTALGWILSGQVNLPQRENVSNLVSMHTQIEPVEQLLKSFWELEAEPSNKQKIMSLEEQRCEDIYHSTTTRDAEGRYVVKLPFRESEPACADGQSRDIALKRFRHLEKKLQQNASLKQEYKKVFNEYLKLNHMVETKCNDNIKGLYLPYHAVIREDKETTKVRIVFDASCKGTNGVSLNDDLMVGPTLQPELRHLIMRWRTYPICFIADIVKMYRQVKVCDEDSEYQRILWRENPGEEIKEYKLLRVTFGTSSAPYLAVKTLIQVATDEGKEFPSAVERIKNEFYMDDLMSGCENVEEAIELYQQINEILSRGGFELQKWSSNSDAMLEKIQEGSSKKQEEKPIEVKFDTINKILGLTWNRSSDEFVYAVKLPPLSVPVTKRKVISDISKLYDPQGWIAPSIIQAKMFIQKLWLAGIDWDQELPPALLDEWIRYRESLADLTHFHLKRWMHCKSDARLVELHGFSDASTAAFGAVVYLRVIDAEGKVHVNLVSAKTKVAPIKQLSVPRLELCGAVLLAKLLAEVSEVLKIPKSNQHAWTDSEVVLAWLSSHPSRWKTFIGNRCSEILSVTDRTQWSHVRSEHNPADCASRGIPASELIDFTLWLHGPSWLQEDVVQFPNPNLLDTNLEERQIQTHLTTAEEDHVHGDDVWTKFSALTKLLRVVAYCRRALKTEKPKHTYLLKKEIDEALVIMIRKCQNQAFSEEIKDLKQKKVVSKRSVLTTLNPWLDEQSLLRVGGRLHFADIKEEQKHPIILPNRSSLTTLIIGEAHKITLHGAAQLMINFIRAKYFILGLKSLVKLHCRKCVTCIRYAAANNPQLMGQLPSPRVTIGKAFIQTGVDYAGPIKIRVSKGRGNRSYKGYICIFVCMATRAVHLDVVSDLTSESFLAAFRRFTGRRGYCTDLYSDNGTNFVGAARELRELFNEERSSFLPEIADGLATKGTQWHFIPPHAPNFGGLWEAAVKSCKFHLKRVIGDSTLTFEELSTVLSQIEACLNSRPISYVHDQKDPMPLTPGHFLIGEPLVVPPDRKYKDSKVSSLRRWQVCQRMLQDFWRRWSQEYLSRFLQRHKWTQVTPEPNVGDVVLVKELDLPPARWLLGRIVEKHPGVDNITRVVTLRYKNSLIKRPVSRICVLPLAE